MNHILLMMAPAPFGAERTGYRVTDLDAAVASAVRHGATRLITSFLDPIGRDVVVQWARAHAEGDRRAAILRFPGGYIAEIHASVKP
ncbi:hypothetical protein EWH08_01935 [Sphingobium indicum]|uniref:Uncharacterized protein n=1 Tax=Sphingobium indicum TaxID=332055 RepID=A0A4Q4JAR4_9SPHN|nr:hypothetical protein [Sphingobium indicum]NYI21956.1 hypothetical protein [Sphingobium indicum]RYM03288.1 hypothetical protein EWH08_01935 [Sphingobium indicum]